MGFPIGYRDPECMLSDRIAGVWVKAAFRMLAAVDYKCSPVPLSASFGFWHVVPGQGSQSHATSS